MTPRQAQALGVLQGALWAAGADPGQYVWDRCEAILVTKRDPVAFARRVVEKIASAREGSRVWAILDAQEEVA